MKPEIISSTLKKMVNHKHLRKLLAKKIDDYLYKTMVNDESDDLRSVQIKRYLFLSAMLHCVNRNVDRGYVTPCAFIPYYVDNIYELYENGKTLADAMFSEFMIKGRQWQREYGLDNWKRPDNWLMPCSVRDHYEIFRHSILPREAKPEDENAREALESNEYFETLKNYDEELQGLTEKIWKNEYLNV